MEWFFDGLAKTAHSGLKTAFIISLVIVLALLLYFMAAQCVYNYRHFRHGGSGKLRSFVNGVRYLYTYRFEDCKYGTELDKAFRDKALRASVPEGVNEIGKFAFAKCLVREISLPSTLRSIDAHAFEMCDLQTLVIPEGVTYIGEHAFAACHLLMSVEMPLIPDMDRSLFAGCYNLKTLVISGQKYDLPNGGDGVDSPFFWDFAAVKLAGSGNAEAERYIAVYGGRIICFFIEQGWVEKVEDMLSLPFELPAEIIDTAVEKAISENAHEIYVMLLQYKRERFGFEEERTEDRFGL